PTPSSTRKHASSCWTSSATPPTTGRTGKYRSDVSILFCSPFCTPQPSRTGERGSSGRPCPRHRGRIGKWRKNAHGQIGGRFAPGAAHEQTLQRGVLASGRITINSKSTPCFVELLAR